MHILTVYNARKYAPMEQRTIMEYMKNSSYPISSNYYFITVFLPIIAPGAQTYLSERYYIQKQNAKFEPIFCNPTAQYSQTRFFSHLLIRQYLSVIKWKDTVFMFEFLKCSCLLTLTSLYFAHVNETPGA